MPDRTDRQVVMKKFYHLVFDETVINLKKTWKSSPFTFVIPFYMIPFLDGLLYKFLSVGSGIITLVYLHIPGKRVKKIDRALVIATFTAFQFWLSILSGSVCWFTDRDSICNHTVRPLIEGAKLVEDNLK